MSEVAKKLSVVNLGVRREAEKTIRPYYKKTHPELASLSELVADFPVDVRPLVEDLGSEGAIPDQRPLSKSDIDTSIIGTIEHREPSKRYTFLLLSSLLTMVSISFLYICLTAVVVSIAYFSLMTFSSSMGSNQIWTTTSYVLYSVFSFLLAVGMVKAVMIKRKKVAVQAIQKEEEPILLFGKYL